MTLTTEFYQKFMRYFYARQDLPRFTTVVERLSKLDPAQASTYAQVLAYVSQNHAIPVLNITIAPQQQ